MASTVHSYSVPEDDIASEERIERLAMYANSKGKSLSSVILKSLEHFETQVIGALWEPHKQRKKKK